MKIRTTALLLILIFTIQACQVFPWGGEGKSGDVLFQDDFSSANSGWQRISESRGTADYQEGAYRIAVHDANTDIWSYPGLRFDDVRVEVDATQVDGPDDNDFGVLCRLTKPNHFYFFIISGDGYYAIGKWKGEAHQLLGMKAMEPSEVIRQGRATNHIRADCIGDTLTLYVNGEKLAEAQDAEYTAGDAGLLAGSFGAEGPAIEFDNFSVLKP